jgi:hypothetical protein
MTTTIEVHGRDNFVPRCDCGAAIGWTRLIRRQPCEPCALRKAQERANLR